MVKPRGPNAAILTLGPGSSVNREKSRAVFISVRSRAAVNLLLLAMLNGTRALCATIELGIDSLVELDGEIDLRASFSWGAARALLSYRGKDLSLDNVSFGVSSPWALVGHLTPTGLAREMENPLGFQAGSDAFKEKTGFRLDGSPSPGDRLGFLLSPVSGALGFFSEPGEARIGAFIALPFLSGLTAECLTEISRPAAGEPVEKWFTVSPSFPGGWLSHLAGRLTWTDTLFSLGASAAVSRCEMAPPGFMFHSMLSAGTKAFSTDLFFGVVGREYVTIRGEGSANGLAFGAKLRLSGPLGSAVLRYAFSQEHEGFAPRPFIPSRERIGIVLEEELPGTILPRLRIRIEAENEMRFDAEGEGRGEADGTVALLWIFTGEESRLGLTFTSTGPKLSLVLRLGMGKASWELEGNLKAREGFPEATCLLGVRIAAKGSVVRFRVGIEGMKLRGDPGAPSSFLRAEVGWEMRRTEF